MNELEQQTIKLEETIPKEIEIVLLKEPRNTIGMAKRFAAYARDKLCFVPQDKEGGEAWFHYNGRHWERTHIGTVKALVNEVVQVTKDRALGSSRSDYDNHRELIQFLDKCEDQQPIKRIIENAQPLLERKITNFDTDPYLFNCCNGTLDLRTGKLRDHNPKDLIRNISEVIYDPSARCPRFEKFLMEIFRRQPQLIPYIQKVCGYLLSGCTNEQCFFIFADVTLGRMGRNGKGTFLHAIRSVMGSYAKNADFTAFGRFGNGDRLRPDRARLYGSRLVTASEPKANQKIDMSFLKAVSGEDPITVCNPYSLPFEFSPEFKVVLSVNQLPGFDDNTGSSFERVHFVPFSIHFDEEERDVGLRKELTQEASGILNWIVEGFNRYLGAGLKKIPEVRLSASDMQDMRKLSKDPYQQMRNEDLLRYVKRFLDDEFVATEETTTWFVPNEIIFALWNEYSYRHDIGQGKNRESWQPKIGKNNLSRSLEKLGFRPVKRYIRYADMDSAIQVRGFLGLKHISRVDGADPTYTGVNDCLEYCATHGFNLNYQIISKERKNAE